MQLLFVSIMVIFLGVIQLRNRCLIFVGIKKSRKIFLMLFFMNNLNIIFSVKKKRRPLVLLTYNQRYIEVQSHAYNSHMIFSYRSRYYRYDSFT